ncbi:hypothetical protein [Pseudomonas sp. CC6-YY-74]|uniref:hypothetical protein n=1 Tax=Pseudomonas sp. CC6-YY-74 TaxID=1930532 RepID=UPI0012AC5492|nr:hypothetical protein [Pseudomonas sp. CC6-YY-74]
MPQAARSTRRRARRNRPTMNPDFTEMGSAYALSPQRDAASYWAQLFGTPQ